MTEGDFRNAVRGLLEQYNQKVEQAIRRELAAPIDLGRSGRLQFEIDPHGYGIHLVQTEEGVFGGVPTKAIPDALLDAADEAGVDLFQMLGEELLPWFAARWQAAGGLSRFSPAYAFFHGGLHQPRYHLEQRRWCSVEEVWSGSA
jgi:hypothetical protein